MRIELLLLLEIQWVCLSYADEVFVIVNRCFVFFLFLNLKTATATNIIDGTMEERYREEESKLALEQAVSILCVVFGMFVNSSRF
jgi:hypothetical protein